MRFLIIGDVVGRQQIDVVAGEQADVALGRSAGRLQIDVMTGRDVEIAPGRKDRKSGDSAAIFRCDGLGSADGARPATG